MRILATLQEMAANEILNIVPDSVYKEIKSRDPDPIFKAYIIGHEGESTGKQVGGSSLVTKWFSTAVRKLISKIKYGLEIFHGHSETNEHQGRTPIGEVVGKALRTINDKLSAVAIAYIFPEYRDLPLDVASIEADVFIDPKTTGYEAVDVIDVTGLALGNSAIEKPGFAGATLLSQIQAFATPGTDTGNKNAGGASMTIDEIKQAIKERRYQPTEVFDLKTIVEADAVKDHFKEDGNYAHLKRTEAAFDKARGEWEKEKKELEKKLNDKETEAAKLKSGEIFEKKYEERKLNDKQKRYIEANKERFTPENTEKVEDEIDKWMDEQLKEYKATAEIFGVKDEDKKGDSGEDKTEGDDTEEGTGDDDAVDFIPD